ncbi:g11373 [Coccomyxa elongata]
MGRPKNTQEVLQLLQAYPKVKGAGVGHSWWKEQACSGNTSETINIVLTEFPEVLALSQRMPETYSPFSQKDIGEVPNQVNEDELTVRVAGGVGQRVLLDWLAAYKTQKSPSGYVLLAFAQYIDQTIAGAIATGTHGSTLTDGSLASQIVSLDIAIANGTLITVTPASNPHLWRAAQISEGRLGIITSAVLKIRRNLPVQRSLLKTDFGSLAGKIKDVQQAYNAATTYMRSDQLWEISFKPLEPEALGNSTFPSALEPATDAMTGVKEFSLAKATAKSAVLLAKEESVASSIDSSTTDNTRGGGYKQVSNAVKLKPDIGFDFLSAA